MPSMRGTAGRHSRVPIIWCLVIGTLGACAEHEKPIGPVAGGDPERGKREIAAYGCGSCHTIPGVGAAHGQVGPPLGQFARRVYIAGEVPNTPRYLVQWIAAPQSIEPGTAMPDLGVTEGQAKDIAAYLYTLR